ncbi:MAG: hypothetical protein ABUL41_00005, partial [Chitinophagaceae bacterium]
QAGWQNIFYQANGDTIYPLQGYVQSSYSTPYYYAYCFKERSYSQMASADSKAAIYLVLGR